MGSSMVMVAIGPTPGSTPTKVPIRQPRKHRPTFLSERATLIPSDRLPTRSDANLQEIHALPQRTIRFLMLAKTCPMPDFTPT